VVTAFAGTGTYGYTGDGAAATSATLAAPWGLAWSNGSLFIADRDNNAIRQVNASTGVITTMAGIGIFGSSGNTGPAIDAELSSPRSVVVAGNGSVIVADTLGNQIRLVAGGTASVGVTVVPLVTPPPNGTQVVQRITIPGTNRVAQAIVLQLSPLANAAAAANINNYTITQTVNGHTRRIRIAQVIYNATTHTLLIIPRRPLKFVQRNPAFLTIMGQPGGNFTLKITKVWRGAPPS
jgi:hypothetical protein